LDQGLEITVGRGESDDSQRGDWCAGSLGQLP
jgi:hypothetical protein